MQAIVRSQAHLMILLACLKFHLLNHYLLRLLRIYLHRYFMLYRGLMTLREL